MKAALALRSFETYDTGRIGWDPRARAQCGLIMCGKRLPNRDEDMPPALWEAVLPQLQRLWEVADFLQGFADSKHRLSLNAGAVRGNMVYYKASYDAYKDVWNAIHGLSGMSGRPDYHVFIQDCLIKHPGIVTP